MIAETATVDDVPSDLIGTTEAAERLGVDRTTFFRWYQLGRIAHAVRLPGKTGALLFRVEDVDALAGPTEAAS